MGKKSVKTRPADQGDGELYFRFALVSFALLLFFPPFFRGLFFKVEQQWSLFFASFVFIACCVWKISERDFWFFRGLLSYAAFALPAVYVIAVFNAANARLAVAEVVKMCLYFIVFWTAGHLARRKDAAAAVFSTFYLSAVLVAGAGFLSAVGVLNIKDGFVGGRIYSTLQYPNALAIFLAAALFFGFWLWLTVSSGRRRLGLALGNFLLMFVFIATNSRGGFLVFAGMIVLYFIGLPREMRISWCGHLVAITPFALLCAGKAIPAAEGENHPAAWLWFALCLAAVFAVNWLWPKASAYFHLSPKEISLKKVAAAVLICIVVAGGALTLWGSNWDTPAGAEVGQQAWYYKVLPDYVANRISQISLETRNAQLRMYWSLQALDIVRESPVIGMGGGAWEGYYRSVQDYPYNSTQVHNQFLQLWAEVGTAGLIIYVGIWILFAAACWSNFHRASDSREKLLDLTLFVSGIGFGVHSFIDFDLALSAVAIVLWTCFGFAWGRSLADEQAGEAEPRGGSKNPKGGSRQSRQNRQKGIFAAGVSILALCFILLPGSLLASYSYQKDGVAYARAGNLAGAEASFLSAANFDPFSSEIKATLASIRNAQKDKEGAIKYMEAAIEESPYDFNLHSDLSGIYLTYGDVEAAVKEGKRAAKCAPWIGAAYESLTEAYIQGGLTCLEKNDLAGARKYFNACGALPGELKEKSEKIPEKAQKLWDNQDEFFNFTPKVNINLGISQLYLGQFDQSETYLQKAYQDETAKPQAGFWLAVLADKTGNEAQAQKYLNQADENLAKNFEKMAALAGGAKTE